MTVKKINGRWRVRWTDENGVDKKKWMHIGATKEDAERFYREVRSKVDRIKAGVDVREKNPHGYTVSDVAAKYVKRGDKKLESVVRVHITSTPLGAMKLDKVRADHIAEHLDSLKPAPPSKFRPKVKATLSKRTANHVRKHLRAMFKLAIEREWLHGKNPVDVVKPKKVAKRTYVTLTPDECSRLLTSSPQPRAGIYACGILGMRKGEIFGLDVADVDTELWQIHVLRSHDKDGTKNNKTRIVPVPPALRPVIAESILLADRKSGVLFPGGRWKRTGKRRTPSASLRRGLDAHMADAGITKRLRFHDLRHTGATMMLQAGVPIQHVSRALGHSSIQITVDLYGHLVVDDVRRAVEAIPFDLKPKKAGAK